MKKIKEKLFNKKTIIIVIVSLLVCLSFFLGYKTNEVIRKKEITSKEKSVEQQRLEIEAIKKERGYVVPTTEEISLQILELEALKEKAKEQTE